MRALDPNFLMRGFVFIVGSLVFALGSDASESDTWLIMAAGMVLWLLVEVIRHFAKKRPPKKQEFDSWW